MRCAASRCVCHQALAPSHPPFHLPRCSPYFMHPSFQTRLHPSRPACIAPLPPPSLHPSFQARLLNLEPGYFRLGDKGPCGNAQGGKYDLMAAGECRQGGSHCPAVIAEGLQGAASS